MRVKTLHLTDFKRFHDLTLDLSERSTKVVALVGPNGSGKSSVFDAFEEVSTRFKGRTAKDEKYFRKSAFVGGGEGQGYDRDSNVKLETDATVLTKTSIYIRSAYRFTARLGINNIRTLPDVLDDQNRPQTLIETDARLTENYERLIGAFISEVYDKNVTGKSWAEAKIKGINDVLTAVLDICVSFIGNPVIGQGSLYFDKGTSKRFPYENLSAGEKEVIDLVLDLYVKKDIYTDCVICIDEPELHLSTAIQRRLLIELEKLVPDNSQLWVATHSIGFLRALQEELRDRTTVIDFTNRDFDTSVTIQPIVGSRADWSRIFATALEDLTGLLAPKRIIYCEGRAEPALDGAEQGLDAEVYNKIFEQEHGDALFVSSGGGGEVSRNALLALRILGKALPEVTLGTLKDRDQLSDEDRLAYLSVDANHRMLNRHEIENYLFDKEVLQGFCAERGQAFDEGRYDAAVTNLQLQDLKPVQQEIKSACGFQGGVPEFKRALASALKPGHVAYRELEGAIFP
jgi:AAA15 family ATPase/GTPase